MHLRGSAPTLLLLLPLCLQWRVLQVRGQEGEYMQEALTALNLPLDTNNKPQFPKNHTGILISKLLHAVQCAEQTGTSQDICDKVRTSLSMFSFTHLLLQHDKLSSFYIQNFVCSSHSCLLITRNVLMAGM